MLLLLGAANRDERRFPDADAFDIHREVGAHLTFGYGPHFCLGAALARLEGRVALDEVLKRFPEWDVDWDRAKLAPTSTVRGWETLPVLVAVSAWRPRRRRRRALRQPAAAAAGLGDPRSHRRPPAARSSRERPIRDWGALDDAGGRRARRRRTSGRSTATSSTSAACATRSCTAWRSRPASTWRRCAWTGIADVAQRIFATVSTHPLPPRRTARPDAHRGEPPPARRRCSARWRRTPRGGPTPTATVAAAMFDVLWGVAPYERLVADWGLDSEQAVAGITWVIGLIEEAVRDGRRP